MSEGDEDVLLVAGLMRIVERVRRIADPLDRAKTAHELALIARLFEQDMCTIRDIGIREDRDSADAHAVAVVARMTGVGQSTVVNARRVHRPVFHGNGFPNFRYQAPDSA